ncbi:hypothetical protein KBY76_04895 [Synechococcus sp. GreenBA-s]|nr:hypothetical protein [Synechococcus sp. GreenBA-s]
MAFTIIPGSSTALTTYEGTDGVDGAAIVSLPNDSTGIDLFAQGADDVVNWGIQLANSSIRGGDGNDLLTPNIIAGAQLLSSFVNGNAGEDTLGGNIQLGISASLTSVLGGQGNDVIYSNNLQSSRLNGNLGDDEIFVGFGIADDKASIGATVNIANSQIFGGQGDDLISITGGPTSVVKGYFSTVVDGNLGDDEIIVALGNGTVFQNSLIAGGDGDDFINAEDTAFNVDLVIEGGEGNDVILGGQGSDDIDTGNGRNFVEGNGGNDFIVGGEGEDTLNGGSGFDDILGGADADIIFGDGESDFLDGEAGDDYIDGGTSSDTIIGGTGDDTLLGSEGFDIIDGGEDADRIVGGTEADELTGGAGDDTFVQLAGSTDSLGLFNAAPVVTAGTAFYNGTNGALFDVGNDETINAGDKVLLDNGFDVITDWTQADDVLITGTLASLVGNTASPDGLSFGFDIGGPAVPNSPLAYSVGQTFNLAVRGTWVQNDDGSESFEVGATPFSGNDILVGTATITGTLALPLVPNFIESFNSISNWTVLDNAGSTDPVFA